MARSTARFISYDLRPAKQTERRILIDVLRTSGECVLPIPTYSYVGMGAIRFYDFLLMHKYLGINKMVSLEHDSRAFKRACFNNPYEFISVKQQATGEFIEEFESCQPTIFWFDYDGGIDPQIIRDISSLAPKVALGDFFFVTACGLPPGLIEKYSMSDRLAWVQDSMSEFAGTLTAEDLENASFPGAVHKILHSAFRSAFATQRDGRFRTFFQVEYSDSVVMVTVGGALLSDGQWSAFADRLAGGMPFFTNNEDKIYKIRSFNLTERERALFDRAATTKRKRSAARTHLSKLGFRDIEIEAYRDLLRYLPRYVETIV